MVHLKDLSIFRIQTNQLLLLNGERGNDCVSFSLETSGIHNDHRIFCQAIEPYSLHGFKPDLSESHFQITAGSTSVIAVASAKRFSSFLKYCGHLELLESLYTSNSLQLQPHIYAKIAQQFAWYFNNPLITMPITLSIIDLPCDGISAGDFNYDGVLNVLDIVSIVNIILYGTDDECEILLSDLNNDLAINVLDIVALINLILI